MLLEVFTQMKGLVFCRWPKEYLLPLVLVLKLYGLVVVQSDHKSVHKPLMMDTSGFKSTCIEYRTKL